MDEKHFKTKAKLTVTATAGTISKLFPDLRSTSSCRLSRTHFPPPSSVNRHVIAFYQSYKFQRKKGFKPLVHKESMPPKQSSVLFFFPPFISFQKSQLMWRPKIKIFSVIISLVVIYCCLNYMYLKKYYILESGIIIIYYCVQLHMEKLRTRPVLPWICKIIQHP